MTIAVNSNQGQNDDIKIFALGGLLEVGKNMYCIEYKNEIIIIDSGILFPEDDLFGIDYIIPDYTYLKQNEDRIKGLFITHGHEDHIGGIPYLLKQVKIPKIFASGFTVELIKKKLEDYGNIKANIYEFNELEKIRFNELQVSFFRVSHSIPDAFGIIIDTPYGPIVSTGDFKFDLTPVGKDANYQRICSLGTNGILLLMSDSTNAKVKEQSTSEMLVRDNIRDLFREIEGRIIVATFASNITRINEIVEASIENGRKILVIGRSMENVVQIGREMGYIKAKEDNFITDKELSSLKSDKVTIISTGSQGEPLSALSRIAQGNHKQIHIKPNDTVIFSSSAIPGNSTEIDQVINILAKQGAKVIVQSSFNDVHASGHASSNEQKLMIKLLRPKYFMPMHGEYYMLKTHAKSAIDAGMKKENVFILSNGKILSITKDSARVLSQKLPAKDVLIDGTDIGGVNTQVIEERKILSKTGMVTIVITLDKNELCLVKPTVISKGFLFAKDNEDVFTSIEEFVDSYFKDKKFTSIETLENELKDHIFNICKQSPSVFLIINRTNKIKGNENQE